MIVIDEQCSGPVALDKLLTTQLQLHTGYCIATEGPELFRKIFLKDVNTQDDLLALCDLAKIDVRSLYFYKI